MSETVHVEYNGTFPGVNCALYCQGQWSGWKLVKKSCIYFSKLSTVQNTGRWSFSWKHPIVHRLICSCDNRAKVIWKWRRLTWMICQALHIFKYTFLSLYLVPSVTLLSSSAVNHDLQQLFLFIFPSLFLLKLTKTTHFSLRVHSVTHSQLN